MYTLELDTLLLYIYRDQSSYVAIGSDEALYLTVSSRTASKDSCFVDVWSCQVSNGTKARILKRGCVIEAWLSALLGSAPVPYMYEVSSTGAAKPSPPPLHSQSPRPPSPSWSYRTRSASSPDRG